MNNNEMNVPDILKELRKLADTSPDGIIAIKGHVIADRIEAAWKREKAWTEADALNVGAFVATTEKSSSVGNAAAMREALNDVISIADREFNAFRETAAMKEMRDKCCSALAAPPRNCDVGTPEEQAKRFALHCDKNPKCKRCQCCGVIPFNHCEFVWAQMPYTAEEGETK